VSALALAVVGGAAIVAAAIVLRRIEGYRVARSLRAASPVSIAEARELAVGPERYVRVAGRVASDEEFPDEHDRPLVYRRRRLEVAELPLPGRWRVLEDEREAVPFGVEDRTSSIDVDASVLGEGLVVLTREAAGLASEVADHLPQGIAPDARVRLRVEQLSAVEHASVAGVPRMGETGRPLLTAGLGRPLVVTPLELPEAMRVLSGGRRAEVRLAAGLLVAGGLLLAIAAAGWSSGLLPPT
jgi:hypothetical protein